jgi:hypothetical protein
MRAVEVRVTNVYVDPTILVDGEPNRIDPLRWRPLIYSFRTYFGLGPQIGRSRQIEKAPAAVFLAAREAAAKKTAGSEE